MDSSGGGGRRSKFLEYQPYTPKDRTTCTAVTFNCFVHPMFVNAGERVAMRINCHGLGNMEDGIHMTQSASNPAIWTVTLQLPMEFNETCCTGIFQVNYTIEDSAVYHMEFGGRRSEDTMVPNYYHVLKPHAADARYQGVSYPDVAADGGVTFLAEVVNKIRTLRWGESEAMIHVTAIVKSLNVELNRADVEQMCEDALLTLTRPLDEPATRLVLCLCAIIGSFGRTSQETEYVSTGGGGVSSMGMMGSLGMMGNDDLKPRKKVPPKPREWCWWILQQMDVDAAFRMELSEVLGSGKAQDALERSHGGSDHGGGGGSGDREEHGGRDYGGRGPRGRGRCHHGGHGGVGGDDGDFLDVGDLMGGGEGHGGSFDPVNAAMEAIAEAAERAAEHGYYDYLRVMPLLKNRRTQCQGELRIVENQVCARAVMPRARCALRDPPPRTTHTIHLTDHPVTDPETPPPFPPGHGEDRRRIPQVRADSAAARSAAGPDRGA
jgi:hypothetical protein